MLINDTLMRGLVFYPFLLFRPAFRVVFERSKKKRGRSFAAFQTTASALPVRRDQLKSASGVSPASFCETEDKKTTQKYN